MEKYFYCVFLLILLSSHVDRARSSQSVLSVTVNYSCKSSRQSGTFAWAVVAEGVSKAAVGLYLVVYRQMQL